MFSKNAALIKEPVWTPSGEEINGEALVEFENYSMESYSNSNEDVNARVLSSGVEDFALNELLTLIKEYMDDVQCKSFHNPQRVI